MPSPEPTYKRWKFLRNDLNTSWLARKNGLAVTSQNCWYTCEGGEKTRNSNWDSLLRVLGLVINSSGTSLRRACFQNEAAVNVKQALIGRFGYNDRAARKMHWFCFFKCTTSISGNCKPSRVLNVKQKESVLFFLSGGNNPMYFLYWLLSVSTSYLFRFRAYITVVYQ